MCETYLAEGEPGESFRLIVRPWPNGWTDVALVYDEATTSAGLAEGGRWVP
ncbi:MAG: hypothetical protein L6Q95_14670 [Planctomycetes bacterium]|nr:hypothetical protein [Planctomycetota bacterium]